MADDKIDSVELLLIAEKEVGEKWPGWKIRVVQWIKEGKSVVVCLERREFYRDKDSGEIRMGKAKGFTAKDFDACKPRWPQIMAMLRNPPPVAAPERPAGGHDDGEVPF